MRLHNFFIEQKIKNEAGEVLIADPEKTHQWLHVFRFGKGDQVILLDNSGTEYLSEFTALSVAAATLKILSAQQNTNMPPQEVFLFQALIKSDKFEWVLQKGTELGVSRFVPILADRSEKKGINLERSKKIVVEASEQCGRGNLPVLSEAKKLEEALDLCGANTIAFHPDAPRFDKRDFTDKKQLAVFVGPEGGWSDREIGLFKEKKVPVFSFSPLILRSETAAIAISSLMLL